MALGYLFPRYPAQQLRREFNRLLNDFMGEPAGGGLAWTGRTQPAINLWETPEALVAEAELPGVKADQLDVAVVGNDLTLKLDRPAEESDGAAFHRRERPVGTFVRVLRLPVEVDADRVEASLHDGVLTLRMPKAEAAKPRKIQVAAK